MKNPDGSKEVWVATSGTDWICAPQFQIIGTHEFYYPHRREAPIMGWFS